MKSKLVYKILLLSILVSYLASSCKKENVDEKDLPDQFNKELMLENIGQNIILSNYSLLNTAISSFENKLNSFKSNLTITELNGLQNSFIEAYSYYQMCSAFEFGPAESQSFRVNFNTFPTDTNQILLNISSSSFVLSAAENIDAKGFPAIDYLLFGIAENDSLILEKYKDPLDGSKRINYFVNIVSDLKLRANQVFQAWNSSSGNYINDFKSSTGNDVGSSISLLVNQLTYDLEILKNAKLAIPIGKKTLGSPLPNKSEAYYAGISIYLLRKNIKNLYNVYTGTDFNETNKQGIDDYLSFLNTDYNGIKLYAAVTNQFNLVLSKLNEVPDPMSQSISNQKVKLDDAYTEIQKLVVMLKNDVASSIGIQITYQDSDGD